MRGDSEATVGVDGSPPHLDDDVMCLVQGTAPGNQPEGNVPEPVGEEETKGEGQEGKGEEQGQLHIAQTVPDLVLQGAGSVEHSHLATPQQC